jgi:hypothetical protein
VIKRFPDQFGLVRWRFYVTLSLKLFYSDFESVCSFFWSGIRAGSIGRADKRSALELVEGPPMPAQVSAGYASLTRPTEQTDPETVQYKILHCQIRSRHYCSDFQPDSFVAFGRRIACAGPAYFSGMRRNVAGAAIVRLTEMSASSS